MVTYFLHTDIGASMPTPAGSKPQASCCSKKHCQNGQRGIVAEGLSIQGDGQLVTLFASVPLTDERWEPLAEGELVAVARGRFTARQLAHESPKFYEQSIDQSALS